MTRYHTKYWAHALTLRETSGTIENLSRSIANARVDLNPHQVDAALFALRSPLSRGVILADEVGLGKTIEAGIVIAQRWAERHRRILLIVPATLRKQWQQELAEKFYLPSLILETRTFNAGNGHSPAKLLDQGKQLFICSYHFAVAKSLEISNVPWDLVIIDEAHRMRNIYKNSNRMAKTISEAVRPAPKLLLTATPLQNSLMELYGLVSVIDDRVFGDAASFRDQFVRATNEYQRNAELSARLKSLCIRTLRRQVTAYIPFTRRMLITQDFTPSDVEQELYELISNYLQRDQLFALPAGQRVLLTLILRKLLASSSFAIAGTLQRLIERLEKMTTPVEAVIADYEGFGETEDEWQAQEDEGVETILSDDNKHQPNNNLLLAQELDDLRQYLSLAGSINQNSKGQALIPALQVAFEKAQALGAARKAVIFTESRRTQQYLFNWLTANGYADELVMMNGDNTDPLSRKIYQEWLERQNQDDLQTGSKTANTKAAIVEYFRDKATILLATEAAAEGVNLQFCSLVVNYDLPWNPQRIEQRIGRCHRYGQKHDVVVVNFLNRRNQADLRVHELLNDKFRLFDGVFGASDEVLGALESGVDIERRIAQLYQTCRNTREITAAFDALQAELESQIQARMTETRQALLENFDEEVNARLQVSRDKTLETLSQRERWLLALTQAEVGKEAFFELDSPRFYYSGQSAPQGYYNLDWRIAEQKGDVFFRQDHPLATDLIEHAAERELPPATLKFDYAGYGAVISALRPLRGHSGWLEVSKLAIKSLDIEEHLLCVGRTDDGQTLDEDLCAKILQLPAEALPLNDELFSLEEYRANLIKIRLRQVAERNAQFFEEEAIKLDRWSDDLKNGLERDIKELDRQIKEARRSATAALTLDEKLVGQRQVKAIELERNARRRTLFEAQDEIDQRREKLIAELEGRLHQTETLSVLFSVRWNLS